MATKRGFQRNLRDRALIKTIALPAAAGASVYTDPLDTGVRSERASFLEEVDIVLTLPPLTTVILPDTRQVTLTVQASATPGFETPTVLRTVTVTATVGKGSPDSVECRTSMPTELQRYLRGRVDFGAGTTDGSALKAELAIVR